MSLVTERIEDNVLYLELNGRIDSSNADQAEELIKAIEKYNERERRFGGVKEEKHV